VELNKGLRAYHCESPACKQDLSTYTKTYYLESAEAPCPLCGLSGHLVVCEVIHLIVPSRNGPMYAPETGGNYKFLCKTAQRNFTLYPQNHPNHPMFYSPLIKAVTCEECLIEYGTKFINAERILLG